MQKLTFNSKKSNRISTKDELYESLKNYRGILNKETIGYLAALIDLNFSVVMDIDDNDRSALSELEVYRKIAIYNIYNRAVNLLKDSGIPYSLSDNEYIDGLNISYVDEDYKFDLFKFDYEQGFTYDKMGESIIPRIGVISLYQTIESPEQRKKELENVKKQLEILKSAENPYHYQDNVYGGPATTWAFKQNKEIEECENLFKKLDSKKELNLKEQKEIEFTKQVRNLILQDYGMTNDDFEIGKSNTLRDVYGTKTEMKRTLVKTMPKLTIKNNIKYI